MNTDVRAQALIIFRKLHQELSRREDELTEKSARHMIIEALSLLPDVSVRADEDHVYVRFGEMPQEVEIRLADAVDSLLTVWRDYESLQEESPGKRTSDR